MKERIFQVQYFNPSLLYRELAARRLLKARACSVHQRRRRMCTLTSFMYWVRMRPSETPFIFPVQAEKVLNFILNV